MDLRSVLNTSDNGDRGLAKAPPTPKQQPPPPRPQEQQHHRQQPQPQPRPSQSPAQYAYRDYARPPPQPSPGKQAPQEYPPRAHHPHPQLQQQQHVPPQHQQPPPSNAYAPQSSPYQTPRQYVRGAPPPLQPTGSFHEARSPSGPAPAPSPYRPVTTPSTAPGGPGFPFPPSQPPPEVNSPVQRHQYPPAQYQPQPQHQRRESFSQGAQVMGPGHAPGPYMQQGQHPIPQTPPITSAVGPHTYIHQRSQSTHSTPTPTSAQSQHHYGPPYAQGSPVAASRPPPGDYSRAPSQPPTPVGPPMPAGSRQPSVAYTQPPSPYQQRLSSTSGAQVAQAQAQAQASPPPPPPPAKRISTSYESPAREIHQRSQSHSERAPSASVSPKTRVPSLQSNPDFAPQSAEAESRLGATAQPMVIDSDRAVTPAKRKLEDRDLSPRELEHRETRPPPGEVNGGHVPRQARRSHSSSSPVMPRKKRLRRPAPPIWAQSARSLGKSMPNHANFVLQKRAHVPVNGKHEGSARPSRHASPETTRSHQPSHSQPSPAEPGPQDILGPWEASITGVKPYEEMSKTVADFLFINVINNEDMQEITSRGIQFEIEAKLGTLIDKDTNHRVDRLLESECVLHDNSRLAFRSSMTEAQHKHFNDFLNTTVVQTDPRAAGNNGRVQVLYKHRREIDRFFDLPTDLQGRLPGCMRARFGSRKNVRVRVTYDQKTREVLGKIIKARVADINLHMPTCPMDCRISINLEMDWDGGVDELEQFATSQVERQPDRNKDRLSYTHGHYQIDLTQVTHLSNGPGGAQRMDKEHELEIELAPGITIDQGRKAISNAPHRYQELVEGFIDNVRILARKAREV